MPRVSQPSKLSKVAARAKAATKAVARPLWKGPEIHGVTQSLLSRYLVCRERFRIHAIEGWQAPPKFSAPLEYGNLWHLCEEVHGQGGDWQAALKVHCKSLVSEYPLQQADVYKWYRVCDVQFPIYLDYWKHHEDHVNGKPVSRESEFKVVYELPNGKNVLLRGRWDGIDLVRGTKAGLWIQENKAKGDIEELETERRLAFDLQTMLYLVALKTENKRTGRFAPKTTKIQGVRYNVIRRPLSGGRHSIRPHQATSKKPEETPDEFYNRLAGLISGEPDYFFKRWGVEVSAHDIDKFEREFLRPCLMELCDWYDAITHGGTQIKTQANFIGYHYRLPYGVYNPLLEGRTGELDSYLETGSPTGLQRITTLFPELSA